MRKPSTLNELFGWPSVASSGSRDCGTKETWLTPKAESLAAATLDKHDAIIRRNLGMNETSAGWCSLKLHVLTGGRTIISPQPSIDQSGEVAPEKTISQDQAHESIASKVVTICGRLRLKNDFFF